MNENTGHSLQPDKEEERRAVRKLRPRPDCFEQIHPLFLEPRSHQGLLLDITLDVSRCAFDDTSEHAADGTMYRLGCDLASLGE